MGNVVRTETDDAVTFTIGFASGASAASVELAVELSACNNYHQQNAPMTIIGESTRTITWTRQRAGETKPTQLPSLTITQRVQPAMAPTVPERTSPDPDSAPAVNGKTDYTYLFNVNEADGVQDDTSYASARVNSAANYGTTITIPTPPHFILNEQGTMDANKFGDKTTISQPGGEGHDIVITVPKGSGSQNYQNAPGYYLVGQINADNTTTKQTFTASGNIVVNQTYVDVDSKTQHLIKQIPDT